MDDRQGALIGAVTLFDVDGEECGKVYSTISGEVVLEWGYKEGAVKAFFDPNDIEAVTTALRMVKAAAA